MNIINLKKNQLIYIGIEVLILFLLFLCLPLKIEVWSIILLSTFVISIFISMTGIFLNYLQIYLFFIFLFNLSQPILVLIGFYEYPSGNNIMESDGVYLFVDEVVLCSSYKALTFSIIGALIGWTIAGNKNYNYSINNNNFNHNYYYVLYMSTWIIAVIYYSIIYKISVQDGYISAVHLKESRTFIDKVFEYISIFYPLFMAGQILSTNDRKLFIKYSTISIIPFVILAFSGTRGNLISYIFVLITIYQFRYRSINIIYFIMIIAILLIFSLFIGATRFLEIDTNLIIFESIKDGFDTLVRTGSSFGVIAYTFELLDVFTNKVPFIFGYIDAIFDFSPNYSIEGILNKSYLAQHLIYNLDEVKYLSGSTIGSSLVAECVELLGPNLYPLLFLIYIIIFYIASNLIYYSANNIYLSYITIIYMSCLYMSPRDSLLRIFNKESFLISVIILIVYLFNSVKDKFAKKAKG